MINKEVLLENKGKHIKLVKDDNFVIDGEIVTVYNDCIGFWTDGRVIFLSFERIKEIVPTRRDAR